MSLENILKVKEDFDLCYKCANKIKKFLRSNSKNEKNKKQVSISEKNV